MLSTFSSLSQVEGPPKIEHFGAFLWNFLNEEGKLEQILPPLFLLPRPPSPPQVEGKTFLFLMEAIYLPQPHTT